VHGAQAAHVGAVEVALDDGHEVDVALATAKGAQRHRADDVEADDPSRQEAVGEAEVAADGTVGVVGDHGRG
jgi:hypothetical protein